jgi:SAM-dependent methyltransferase
MLASFQDRYSEDELLREEIRIRDVRAADYLEAVSASMGAAYNAVELETVLDWLAPQPHETVLDAGCGVGRLTPVLARTCRRVFAVDHSSRSIEILRERLLECGIGNVESSVGDLTQPSPFSEIMDKVVSVQTLQHIPGAGKRLAALSYLLESLKPGGTLVFTGYNHLPRKLKHGLRGRALKQETIEPDYLSDEDERGIGLYCHRFRPDELRDAMANAGFADVRIGGCNNVPRAVRRLLGRTLGGPDRAFSRSSLSRYTGAYLIVKGVKPS